MPELPEVETTRRGVAPHVEGRSIANVLVREPRLRWPVADSFSQDLTGRVDFLAKYTDKRGDQEHRESSIFKKKNGKWFFGGGKPGGGGETIRREEPKVGRNDPCHCGSGKKFKKCHGKAGAKN